MTHHENALKVNVIWMWGKCWLQMAQTSITILEVIKGGGEAISVTVYSPKRKLRETAKNSL